MGIISEKWRNDLNQVTTLRSKAKHLEKENQLHNALALYKESVTFGEKSENLNLANYGHDIERIIILLGKTKQKNKLAKFLQEVIEKYPDSRDFEKWKERLSKIKK